MISFIFAMDKNRVIGKNNTLPWHLPADLQFFKNTTMRRKVIMGRKTFESIGKPLPGRKNFVLTTDTNWPAPSGVITCSSVEEVMSHFTKEEEVFVIGGSQIFNLFMPYADKIYCTLIDYEFDGDSYFPEISEKEWKNVFFEKGEKDDKNPYDFYFQIYERKDSLS